MKTYSIKELAAIFNVDYNTLSVYLAHYSFNKYQIGGRYHVNSYFLKNLIRYLYLKKNLKYIEKVKRVIEDGKLFIAKRIERENRAT